LGRSLNEENLVKVSAKKNPPKSVATGPLQQILNIKKAMQSHMEALEQLIYQYTESQQEGMEEKSQSSGESSASEII
jgi:hypothetical protein